MTYIVKGAAAALLPKIASKAFSSLGTIQTLISQAGPALAGVDPTGVAAVYGLLAIGLGITGYDLYEDIQSGKKIDDILARLRNEVGKHVIREAAGEYHASEKIAELVRV